MPLTVSQLAIAPVKGMRLHCTSEIGIGQHGVTGDREFLVIGEDGKLLLTSQAPALLQVEPAWDRARDVLALRFPGRQCRPGHTRARGFHGHQDVRRAADTRVDHPWATQRRAVRLPRPGGAPIQTEARAHRSR